MSSTESFGQSLCSQRLTDLTLNWLLLLKVFEGRRARRNGCPTFASNGLDSTAKGRWWPPPHLLTCWSLHIHLDFSSTPLRFLYFGASHTFSFFICTIKGMAQELAEAETNPIWESFPIGKQLKQRGPTFKLTPRECFLPV